MSKVDEDFLSWRKISPMMGLHGLTTRVFWDYSASIALLFHIPLDFP